MWNCLLNAGMLSNGNHHTEKSNTQYKVRVQAENTAGNGSSSQYVSFKVNESKSRQRDLCKFVRYDAV